MDFGEGSGIGEERKKYRTAGKGGGKKRREGIRWKREVRKKGKGNEGIFLLPLRSTDPAYGPEQVNGRSLQNTCW